MGLSDFTGYIAELFFDFRNYIAALPLKIKEFAHKEPRLMLLGAGGFVLILVIVVLVMVVLSRSGGRPGSMGDSDAITGLFANELSGEEFFLGEEPDFLPRSLLERNRRDSWTAEDAAPFWTDPMEEGPRVYEDLMKDVVDRIMERVP
ncbi:MAG: hypothetical protein LBT16_14510 [Treponema sp.]|jgi:hypothetical protein|nr:hypothetical protein [Treponema sp.]